MSATLAPRRIVGVALAFTFVGATIGVVVAASSNPGPFTGCLAKDGDIHRVAVSVTAPLKDCGRGETQITFSNAQGPPGGATRAIVPIMFDLSPGTTSSVGCGPIGWKEWTSCEVPSFLSTFYFDPADYPPGANVALSLKIWVAADSTYCVRLAHAQDATRVAGSESCADVPGFHFASVQGMTFQPYRSGYLLQENLDLGEGRLIEAYLDIDW